MRAASPHGARSPSPRATAQARSWCWRAVSRAIPDALPIRAEARVLGATLKAGESAEYAVGNGRHLYLVPAEGEVEVNGVTLNARDGAAIADEAVVKIKALADSEIVLVDAA